MEKSIVQMTKTHTDADKKVEAHGFVYQYRLLIGFPGISTTEK